MKMNRLCTLSFLVLFLIGCQVTQVQRQVEITPTPSSSTPQPSEESQPPINPPKSTDIQAWLDVSFALKVGQAANIPSDQLKVQFIRVKEDSRCPVGTTCVWAGRVTVEVTIAKQGKDLGHFDLSTTERKGQYVDNYLVGMGKVSPAPTDHLNPEEYSVELKVSKFVRKTT